MGIFCDEISLRGSNWSCMTRKGKFLISHVSNWASINDFTDKTDNKIQILVTDPYNPWIPPNPFTKTSRLHEIQPTRSKHFQI